MSLLAPDSAADAGTLRAMIEGSRSELRERLSDLERSPPFPPAIESRRWTAQALLRDALELAESRSLGSLDARELRRLANLLYDVELVAAEYSKLFFRDPRNAPPTPVVRLPPESR